MLPLVVVPYFAVMDGGHRIGISHVPLFHHGINHPVIGAFHALFHAATQVGQCVSEDGTAFGFFLQHIDASKTVSAGWEALEKMSEELLMVLLAEDIQHKLVANLHQSLDGPVFGHGHGDAWWGESWPD